MKARLEWELVCCCVDHGNSSTCRLNLLLTVQRQVAWRRLPHTDSRIVTAIPTGMNVSVTVSGTSGNVAGELVTPPGRSLR